jgi:hypothetical protein
MGVGAGEEAKSIIAFNIPSTKEKLTINKEHARQEERNREAKRNAERYTRMLLISMCVAADRYRELQGYPSEG